MSRIELVSDIERLRELQQEWRRLAELRANAFVTPEWFFSWWRHYGQGLTPLVTVVRNEGGGLRGLMPLAGKPRVCRIAGANVGDCFHPVCEPRHESELGAAAGQAMAQAPIPWSRIYLDNVAGEEWIEAFVDGDPARLRLLERASSSHASIELGEFADWPEYVASRSSKLRTQVRRNARRLEREGVRARMTAGAGEVARDIQTFFRLHDLRWSGRGGSSLSPAARAFHSDFAAAALRRGWLRLWFLERDGEAIASWYGWSIGGVYAYYNGGFDPEWRRYGPGAAIVARAIEAAFEEGASRFDFLLGEEPYKLRFAEPSRQVKTLVIARARRPASLLASADVGLRGLGGRLPDRIGRDSALARRLAGFLPGSRRG